MTGCTSKHSNTPVQNTNTIPGHIKDLKNLVIISTDSAPQKLTHFEDTTNYGVIYPIIPPPSRGFGPNNAVDNNGKVYRADKGRMQIVVFDANGLKIGTVGKPGKGPGEFLEITALFIQNNKLVVYDSNMLRLTIFDIPTLSLLKVQSLDPYNLDIADEIEIPHPRTIHSFKDNLYLTGFSVEDHEGRSYIEYYGMDENGKIVSKKLVAQQRLLMHTGVLKNGSTGRTSLVFSTKGLLDVDDDGNIYQANTGEFLINIYNSKGVHQKSLYFPFKRAVFNKEEFESQLSSHIQSLYENVDYPESWPALQNLIIDDENRIWVSTIGDDKTVNEWWVLNTSGEILFKFTWPAKDKVVDIRNGMFYVEIHGESYSDTKVLAGYLLPNN